MALNRDDVLAEAIALADERGLDDLTLRGLATRLGVQAPTLYWHVKNKAELLDALSDAIMAEAIAGLEAVPAPGAAEQDAWRPWLAEVLVALRRAMLAHRDGARIVAGARGSLGRVDYSERVMTVLIGHGMTAEQAWLTTLAGQRYTIGHVLAEQGPDSQPEAEDFTRRFPLLTEAVGAYFGSGGDADGLFRHGIRMLLALPASED